MDDFEKLRQEFTNSSFREMIKEKLGGKCVNCGSEENIEYHHIVPLRHGGTNNLGNIVPLCCSCHHNAHNKHIHGEAFAKARQEGRVGRKKLIEYEDAKPILHKYFNLEIGLKEAKRELGLSPKSKSTWYKLADQYREEYNIPNDFRNNIDILASQDKRRQTLMQYKEEHDIQISLI